MLIVFLSGGNLLFGTPTCLADRGYIRQMFCASPRPRHSYLLVNAIYYDTVASRCHGIDVLALTTIKKSSCIRDLGNHDLTIFKTPPLVHNCRFDPQSLELIASRRVLNNAINVILCVLSYQRSRGSGRSESNLASPERIDDLT